MARPNWGDFDQVLQLRPDLPRLVLRAMHIHIQIAGLETRVLLIRELRTRGDGPHAVRALAEGNDGRAALAWRAHNECVPPSPRCP